MIAACDSDRTSAASASDLTHPTPSGPTSTAIGLPKAVTRRPTGRSWRVDETYAKLRGRWVYLYRAVDRAGQTVDFRLSARRDLAAAKAFFKKASKSQGHPPQTITLDGYAASHRAVREMKADRVLPENTKLRSSKYLNNLIEQDHRNIKSRVAVRPK